MEIEHTQKTTNKLGQIYIIKIFSNKYEKNKRKLTFKQKHMPAGN